MLSYIIFSERFLHFSHKNGFLLLPALFARVRQAQPLFSRLFRPLFFSFALSVMRERRRAAFRQFYFLSQSSFSAFAALSTACFASFFVALFNIFGFGCLKVRAFLPHFFSSSAKVYGAGFGGERLFVPPLLFSSEETHFFHRGLRRRHAVFV